MSFSVQLVASADYTGHGQRMRRADIAGASADFQIKRRVRR
jgi:hypothetical protein